MYENNLVHWVSLQGKTKNKFYFPLKALSQVIAKNVNLCFFVCQFEDFHEKKQL